MPETASLLDGCDAVEKTAQETLTWSSDSHAKRLRALAELHDVTFHVQRNLWFWDVQKRRTVTVAYLVGTHTRGLHTRQGCSHCAAIAQVLTDLMVCAVPPQGNRCQHMIGVARFDHGEDDLCGNVHEVSLPVILIHRLALNDHSCGSRCVEELRAHLKRLCVRGALAAQTDSRSTR